MASEEKKPRPSPLRRRRLFTTIKLGIFLVFLGICAVGLRYTEKVTAIIRDTPKFDIKAFSNLGSPTLVYDRNGNVLTELRTADDRELIQNTGQVSHNVVNAFVAAEDKDFFHHFGINPVAMARATVQDLLTHHTESGASTITQQTVKLVMFPEQQRTVERKIQEIVLAIRLEKVLTKNEILTDYMNWIYFGQMGNSNIYGVVRASKTMFDKAPSQLNLAQAAFLASIPNNPSLFSPYDEYSNTISRQHYVLQNMLQLGFIDQAQYAQALAFNVKASLQDPFKSPTLTRVNQFPFVNNEIRQKAMDLLTKNKLASTPAAAEEALASGGYQIYTTIDERLQTVMDKAISNPDNYDPPVSYSVPDGKGGLTQVKNAWEEAGATLIDNRTGGILAIGGGRDFQHDQNNHTLLPRQPGSSIKPLADYGPAFDLHLLSPGSVIDDVPMVWPDKDAPGGQYFPMNWDHQFHGLVSARTALYESLNIPALKVFMMVTPPVGLGYLEKMGITTLTPQDMQHVASGIGGLANGLTVEQETSAYTTFPNQGAWKPSYLITKIVDRSGRTIYQHQLTTRQVYSPQAAYLMTDVMRDVVKKGTASYYVGRYYANQPVAGKTGTTDGNKDAWFVGFTPQVTLGVWNGYDIPYPMSEAQSHHSQTIWTQVMQGIAAYGYAPKGQFTEPSGIVRVKISTKSGTLPSRLSEQLGDVTTDLFIQGTQPTTVDNVLVQAKYVIINGVKYLATPNSPPGDVKVGIFIKRAPYTLPNGNRQWLPLDYGDELPSKADPRGPSAGSSDIPNHVHVSGTSVNSISLQWDTVTGSGGYIVLRSASSAGPYVPVTPSPISETAYVDSSVDQNVVYYYEVESVNAKGMSAPSPSVSGQTGVQKLSAPQNFAASVSGQGVVLNWQSVESANSYVILRSKDGSSTFQPLGTVSSGTTYTDTSVQAGLSYRYQVIASGSNGDSDPAEVSVSVPQDWQPVNGT